MINAALHAAREPQHAPTGGITELVLTHNAPEQTQLLLPMVAHLSQSRSERWLTWINPGPVDRSLLAHYGVDTHAIRMIHVPENEDNRWILWEALACGNSHTVIADSGAMSDRELKLLETAALKGQCQGLLLRMR